MYEYNNYFLFYILILIHPAIKKNILITHHIINKFITFALLYVML